jgi:hypothetical protein
LLQRDAALKAGKARPKAEVVPLAEGDIREGPSIHAQVVRLGKRRRVAVRRPEQQHYALAGLYCLAADDPSHPADPYRTLNIALESKDF